MSKQRPRVHASVSSEVKQWLEERAQDKGISLSAHVAMILTQAYRNECRDEQGKGASDGDQ